MPARHQLPSLIAVFAIATLILTGCSSDNGTSAGSGPPHMSPATTDTAPPATTSSPSPSTAPPSTSPLTVGITTLHAGDTLTLPAAVGYTVNGPRFTASDGYQLRLTLGGAGSYSRDLPLGSPTGTVTIPRDKMLPGKRDLTFSLVRNGQATGQPAHLAGITIYGPK